MPLSTALLASLVIALVISAQFLFQPFIWRHWPLDEVLLGWVEVLRDRMVVAVSIALAFSGAERLPLSHPLGRATALGIGILAGALAGELVLMLLAAPAAAGDGLILLGRVLRWSGVAAAVSALLHLHARAARAGEAMHQAELARLDGERQLADLRLQALRAQIEPHFLFNTLATVRRLGNTDPALCARLLEHLHDFTRLSQAAQPEHPRWTLGQELDLLRAYLGVIAARMDGRLQVSIDCAAAMQGCELPPLLLATLVENAVKHGIAPSTAGGSIVVTAALLGNQLELTVSDTGVGFQATSGTGIGLANARARLRSLYGNRASLVLRANHPRGVTAGLSVPVSAERAT